LHSPSLAPTGRRLSPPSAVPSPRCCPSPCCRSISPAEPLRPTPTSHRWVKASRPLIHVLVINENHYGLTFLFEL
jgi:hypothetical protein